MEEESQQLDQVIVDVTIFLLNTDDVWREIWFIFINLALVEGEESELEEVLNNNGDLEGKQRQHQSERQLNQREQ